MSKYVFRRFNLKIGCLLILVITVCIIIIQLFLYNHTPVHIQLTVINKKSGELAKSVDVKAVYLAKIIPKAAIKIEYQSQGIWNIFVSRRYTEVYVIVSKLSPGRVENTVGSSIIKYDKKLKLNEMIQVEID